MPHIFYRRTFSKPAPRATIAAVRSSKPAPAPATKLAAATTSPPALNRSRPPAKAPAAACKCRPQMRRCIRRVSAGNIGQIVQKQHRIPFTQLLFEQILRGLQRGHDGQFFRLAARIEVAALYGADERFAH